MQIHGMKIGILAFLFCLVFNDFARTETQQAEALLANLRNQLSQLTEIKTWIERRDLGRIVVLEKATQQTMASIEDPALGLGHYRTFVALQNLIIAFRYSNTFFAQINMPVIHKIIEDLKARVESLAQQFGFDDAPYTKITQSVYAQIHKLVLQLLEYDLKPSAKIQLHELIPLLGVLIAQAQAGDRPKTYAAAQPVYLAIDKTIREEFGNLNARNPAFSIAVEIDGLNQYYGEVAQNFEGLTP